MKTINNDKKNKINFKHISKKILNYDLILPWLCSAPFINIIILQLIEFALHSLYFIKLTTRQSVDLQYQFICPYRWNQR